ncbi:hypothetical protein [Sphingomonas sp. S2M10]|uniref:hypothetical protein n=1 Tax=Sphingomonas sp. S2M10 TaxID=2705010 RepID=UPI00145736EF|nr:hypothetical protein [Sphingomonas sp. S2M10]
MKANRFRTDLFLAKGSTDRSFAVAAEMEEQAPDVAATAFSALMTQPHGRGARPVPILVRYRATFSARFLEVPPHLAFLNRSDNRRLHQISRRPAAAIAAAAAETVLPMMSVSVALDNEARSDWMYAAKPHQADLK